MATRGTSRHRARRDTALSFFGSRQRFPTAPRHYLRRPRLLRLLDDAASAPIISVVAPAGSGKTSLLVDWCTSSSAPTAWLSVDRTDRDGGQFWSAVAASLGGLTGGLADHGSPVRTPGSLSEAVAALVATLEGDHPDSAMLVLDDIHLIDHDEAVVASLALFLQSLPEWLHVVLLSRRTPKLPIDRLRVRGELGEVHFAELRFTDAEAEELLTTLAPAMAEQDVCAVVGRACGWAAGLQLTALAVRSAEAQPGAPAHVDIGDLLFSDYVWHEVLATERREVVEALLDTSVVRRTNAGLASALTGRPDAGELLLEAEARGLFVTRLGSSGWLEVHTVVRDELLAEAKRRSPERVASQHARAAQWFEDSGELSSALEQWLLASRPRDALRLLARNVAELYDTGLEATITHTISRIPLNVANADLPAMIEFAWCHLLVDRHRFIDSVNQASAGVERFADPGPAPMGRLRMLQAVTATITGDWAGGSRQATAAMSLLGESARSDMLGRFGWNMVARDIALSERWNEPSPELEDVRLELSRDAERRLAYEGTRALGKALAGHPVDALRIAAGLWKTATVNSMTILRTELGIAQAVAHRELGDRPRALTELSSLAESRTDPVTYAQVLALMEITQLRLDDGDLESAEETFQLADEFVRRDFSGAGGLDWLARTGTRVALAAGEPAVARSWSEQIADPFWRAVGFGRVQLFEGRRADAATELEQVAPRCLRHEVVLELLRARAADREPVAVDHAVRAVTRTLAAGLVQTVASEGAEALDLLERHAWMAPKEWLDRLRRAACPHAGGPSVDPSLPGEHLTERELEVLRMLPSRLTLREIAGELFISVNTLKFHLRLIYRKLGVGSRDEAAAVVRRLTSTSRAQQSRR
jgi:LuxR family maltose regulon positive regulatory protein